MRLPADATLIVVGAPGEAGDRSAAARVAALREAWRREDLPAIDVAAPAFDGGGLEARLDDLGATTLVLCGGKSAVERAAQDAEASGFRAFVVRDACWRDEPSTGARGAGTAVDTTTALAAAALARARQRRGGR